MKTINRSIDIFTRESTALNAFDKCKVSCHLLKSGSDYYLDRSKTALKAWPNLYTLIKEK